MTCHSEERTRRQQKDHERYMAHHDERCARQRAYYAANREKCKESVRRSEQRRAERDLPVHLAHHEKSKITIERARQRIMKEQNYERRVKQSTTDQKRG